MAKTKKETSAAEAVADVAPEAVAEELAATDAVNTEDATADIVVFPATENVEESVTEKFGEEAAALFAEYPENDAFHFTSDGLAFFQHGDARNHASSLEDKEVVSKVRKK